MLRPVRQNIETGRMREDRTILPAPYDTGRLDTLVLLLSCQKTEDRREACRQTWLSHGMPEGMRVLFVVGKPGQPSTLSGDVLTVDAPDTYVGLPYKTHAMIREALTRFEFDWLFKADDDTFINLPRLACYPKTRDYMGRKAAIMGDDPDWHRKFVGPKEKMGQFCYESVDKVISRTRWCGPWANGGSGYFLSHYACRLVAAENPSHISKDTYEDKLVGDIMISNGIFLWGAHSTLRHKVNPDSRRDIIGATTLHPLDPEDMYEVYWKLLRAEEIGT